MVSSNCYCGGCEECLELQGFFRDEKEVNLNDMFTFFEHNGELYEEEEYKHIMSLPENKQKTY